MLTIAETPDFAKHRDSYWDDEEFAAFCLYLAQNPTAGVVIPKTGGCRKVRWSVSGRGKRGGVRVIYVNRLSEERIWLLTMYAKNVSADVERKIVNKLRESLDA